MIARTICASLTALFLAAFVIAGGADDRVRITVQLVNVADGYQLWSERYDRTMSDVFALQEEIAGAAGNLRPRDGRCRANRVEHGALVEILEERRDRSDSGHRGSEPYCFHNQIESTTGAT